MCKKLEISEQNAITAYNNAGTEGRTLLTNLFGNKVFSQKITDRVKSFADVLTIAGKTEEEFLRTCGTSPDNIAYEKLKLITEVLNEGWEPNWENTNEYKYYPRFKMGSGFGLSYYFYVYVYVYTTVGSRLVFKSSALVEYAAATFLDIYKAYFVKA